MTKVAIVTGAGTGVGRAAALALMKAGYSVALAGRRKEPLDTVLKEGGGNGIAVPTDVKDVDAIRKLFATVVDQAERYFVGQRIDFSEISLDLSNVDPLRRAIYDALRKVSFGETVTYGELATRAGVTAPQAAQDVGVAMARNPVPLIIPCHRVLAAGGKLGGFSAPGRTETKERMLALEGVFIGNQPRLL